jgi:acetoin utilization protein AcuB
MFDSQTVQTASVADIMCPNPKTIIGMDTVREALRLMNYHQIRHLVVTAPSGAICGLISQRDILRSLALHADGLALIHDVMSVPVIHTTPDESVCEAARVMWNKRIGSLPVLSPSSVLVGIVTRSDVLRHFGASCFSEWTDS